MVAGLLAGCGSSSSGSSSSASSAASSSSKAAASSSSEAAVSGTSTAATSATSGSEEEYKTDKDYNVDVILKTTSSEYWKYVEAGAKSYNTDYPNVKVDVKGATSETAYDEQQNMIETDLNSGAYDGYSIAPLQADLAAKLIAGQTKPIIAIDTKIEAPEIVTFVGLDQEEAAKQGGTAAVQMAKDLGWDEIKCIEIAGVQGDETCTARMNGYKKGVNEAGGEFLENEVQYADTTADKAVAAMEGIMSTHPEGIAIVAANNDDMAMAAARTAAGNEAYKNTVFLGFNGDKSACQAMADGTYTNYISVAQEAYGMGYKAVEAAVKAVDGVKLDRFTDSGSEIITKDNAQERLDTLSSYLNS